MPNWGQPVHRPVHLMATLLSDTTTIFNSALAEWQKLDCFRKFLFPRLSFILRVISPGVTWRTRLDTSLRSIVKKGIRLPLRTCTEFFYLPQAVGGMGIPSVLHELHVARASQAFKFLADKRDPVVRSVARDQLSDNCKACTSPRPKQPY